MKNNEQTTLIPMDKHTFICTEVVINVTTKLHNKRHKSANKMHVNDNINAIKVSVNMSIEGN